MSQLTTESKQISGHVFTVAKLDPLTAQDVMIDLGQALAPAFGKAAAGAATALGGDSLLDVDVEDPKVSGAVTALVQGISKAKMRELVQTMASVSTCDDIPLAKTMAVTFRGDLPLMYEWLWFSLRVNFGNFFAWGQNAISGALASAPAVRSQTTSKGIGQS